MTDRGRFRHQDPDDQYGQEEYAGQDDSPSSLGYDSALGYEETHNQGGRIPSGDFSHQGDYMSERADGVRSPLPGERHDTSRPDDEYGFDMDEY